MLDNTLIESALALTGKTKTYCHVIDTSISEDDNYDPVEYNDVWDYPSIFSIEKFCYYLLSPEFLKEYCEDIMNIEDDIADIWEAIYEYQLWNEKPLVELLSKI